MEQLNYSFFLLVLGDRLLKTDGQRSVHTLAVRLDAAIPWVGGPTAAWSHPDTREIAGALGACVEHW